MLPDFVFFYLFFYSVSMHYIIIYNVKRFIFQINAFILNFYSILF